MQHLGPYVADWSWRLMQQQPRIAKSDNPIPSERECLWHESRISARRRLAPVWAGLCEAITGAGAISPLWSRAAIRQQWTVWADRYDGGEFPVSQLPIVRECASTVGLAEGGASGGRWRRGRLRHFLYRS